MLCVLPAEIAWIAACSGGGTVVELVGNLQCCDSNDRSQGIAATAMRTKASKMGSFFLMSLICRICRIFQRFAL
jgi:hypothetical protein